MDKSSKQDHQIIKMRLRDTKYQPIGCIDADFTLEAPFSACFDLFSNTNSKRLAQIRKKSQNVAVCWYFGHMFHFDVSLVF